jgi:FkbH-like protein
MASSIPEESSQMGAGLYAELAWLPRPPEDFYARCRSASEEEEGSLGLSVQALARYALDENQLIRLAKLVAGARQRRPSLSPLVPFRLGIVSNATSRFIVPALVASAARHGIALECCEANFDQVVQEVLSPTSAISRAQPDAVLIAIDHRGLPLRQCLGDAAVAEETVEAALAHLALIRKGVAGNSKAICIVQTVARPPETIFGNGDLAVPGTMRSLVDRVNRGIAESISGSGDVLFDVAGLAETVGLANWHDPTLWNLAKLPFSNGFLPLYADHVGRIVGALRGKSRRCLILDLDNTVWGGVIGDDGLEGIVIGQGDATGEAHLAVQQTAFTLRERGIVLAVSSKNHDEVARTPFQRHPDMLLREEHIAVFQANWDDKATNIKAIADALSLGLDSMVLLDDNPAERALVRQLLPQVAVPELPDDPALFARMLLASGYFEAVAFSAEDRQRAGFYEDNARRVALRGQATDLGTYLASLEMVMTVQPFDERGRNRIVQLINKSNQYNLTTIRYTERQVEDAQRDPDCITLQARLSDKFGDNGMISVVICRQIGRDWHVDTWLMSCRVLGRRIEDAILQELLLQARQRGVDRIIGAYHPTQRNQLVEDHYAKLGFAFVERREDGTTVWQLSVTDAPGAMLPLEVRRLGAELAGV